MIYFILNTTVNDMFFTLSELLSQSWAQIGVEYSLLIIFSEFVVLTLILLLMFLFIYSSLLSAILAISFC